MEPAALVDRLRRLQDGTLTPVPARDSATVLLLRDGPAGPEAYLLRRRSALVFAGGRHVFPGGAVEPGDVEPVLAGDRPGGWAGPAPGEWAARLRCDEVLARGLVRAAVRETFEEAGVLLAGPPGGPVLDDVAGDAWEDERARLDAGEQTLPELLARRGLVLRSDLLRPLAHWITPEAEPKRFDTRFFLAALPPGQQCRAAGSEADERVWVRPAEARARGLSLMPPTAAALAAVADAPDVAAALAAERTLAPVLPRLALREGRVVGDGPGWAGGTQGAGPGSAP